MGKATSASVPLEAFFAGHPGARAIFEVVRQRLAALGPVEVRVSRSQVAFRRTRAFAHLWLPGRYLRGPRPEAVLSIALARRDESARFKEVAHPAPGVWIHHLEVDDIADIDDEVVAWLAEALEERG